MVQGITTEKEIIEWKMKHIPQHYQENGTPQTLNQKYWISFVHQNLQLSSKKAIHFNSNHDDWCTYSNFNQMYKAVYTAMVESRVAIMLDEEVHINRQGQVTTNKDKAYGWKMKYLLTQPENVNEVGDNTSQKNVGNIGGQKFIVDTNQHPLIQSSNADSHFTILWFTTAAG